MPTLTRKVYKNKPLVSIIAIVSRCDFLQDLLESIFEQRSKRWELILLVNGFSGKEKKIVQGILDRYKTGEMKVYFHKRIGVGIARKKLFRLAKCPYILPVDDDDMLVPTAVAEVIKCFRRHPGAAIVRAGKVYIDAYARYSNGFARQASGINCHPLPRMQMYGMTMDVDNVFQLYCVNKSFLNKTEELKTYRDFSHMGEDLDLFLKLEELGDIIWINKILYFKRLHKNNVLKKFSKEKLIQLELRYIYNAIRRRKLKIKVASVELLERLDVDGLRRPQHIFKYKMMA
ncbi:MAG: glycosyltransferase family 2 protein [Candidatus Omnitrophota bacterium]